MTYTRIEHRKNQPPSGFFHSLVKGVKFSFTVAAVLLFIAFIFFISHFRLSKQFPIKNVHVYGMQHIRELDVRAAIQPLVSHGFFSVSVEKIRDRLMQEPWAADVLVQRQWPDELDVTIIEKVPSARWSSDTLLSNGGLLFTPKGSVILTQSLPIFSGPDGQHILMLNYFNEMNRLLKPIHAKISYLELTPYLSWHVRLDNGIAIELGNADILMRLSDFVSIYPKVIGDNAKDVDSIDLRYSNGVAVKWKTPIKI